MDEGILTGTNMLITGEGGSGKTLAYLLPILNSFYKQGRRDPTQFIMDVTNEDTMFQNADELHYKNRKNKTSAVSPLKGAIVVSYSKELVS